MEDHKQRLSALKSKFSLHADAEKSMQMAVYMKNIAPYYGIPSTERRELLKACFADWKPDYNTLHEVVLAMWAEPQREWQYCAMELLFKHKKIWKPEVMGLIEELIITKSWWDTVDLLASSHCGHYFTKYPEFIPKYIPKWIASDNMWLNRSAIIFQLKYGVKTNVALLSDAILPHIASKEFFHQKAIGWALRQYARTNPEFVLEFVAIHALKPLSKREALKHL
jgi:3-methyladenine DNA glycosylase AlkD